jgi:hypothetical protein
MGIAKKRRHGAAEVALETRNCEPSWEPSEEAFCWPLMDAERRFLVHAVVMDPDALMSRMGIEASDPEVKENEVSDIEVTESRLVMEAGITAVRSGFIPGPLAEAWMARVVRALAGDSPEDGAFDYAHELVLTQAEYLTPEEASTVARWLAGRLPGVVGRVWMERLSCVVADDFKVERPQLWAVHEEPGYDLPFPVVAYVWAKISNDQRESTQDPRGPGPSDTEVIETGPAAQGSSDR